MKYFIYKLKIGEYWYIGSSYQKENKRYDKHKSDCFNENSNGYNYKVYKYIRSLGITFNTFKEEVKEIIIMRCKEEEEHSELEDKYINLKDPFCLNDRRENQNRYNEDGTNNKEYSKKHYQENKEHIIKQQKKYREDNKEHLREIIICEFCQTLYQRQSKSRHQKKSKLCKDAQYFYELD